MNIKALLLHRLCTFLVVAAACSSCHVHSHRVGGGPTGTGEESLRQYYLLFGWIRLNEADSQRLTDDLSSYEIDTRFSGFDLLLAPLLLPLTVTSRTVTVYR